jgi:hypothetical protein
MFLNLSSLLTNDNLSYSIVYKQLLAQFGSTYFTEVLFVLTTFISIIGLCLNLITIGVLFGEKFKSKKLFDYIKFYVINSTAICIISLPGLLMGKQFVFTNQPYGPYFLCYIYGPLLDAFYVFSSLIDVAILLDRIALFTRRFDFAKNYSVRSVSALSYACGLLIGIQFLLTYYPEALVTYLSQTVTVRFYFVNSTQFITSQIGTILLYIKLFIKDIVTVALVATFNIISIALLRRYLKQRSKLLKIDNLNTKNNTLAINKSATDESLVAAVKYAVKSK